MSVKIGIDVGGTFTDFLVTEDGQPPRIHKTLSTPDDPSIGVITGLKEIAENQGSPQTLEDFIAGVDTIVHGTTVTTNATLTRNGAKTGLLTTQGVRDALEMRRGIREEQYNNRYENVEPLVPRYLRVGIEERLDRNGEVVTPLNADSVSQALKLFKEENVEAIAVCFMNSFVDAQHERLAGDIINDEMPNAYTTLSADILPSIRFYERVSTTVLNSYVGPILRRYIDKLVERLRDAGFGGILLIMQSNGGVMAPDVAKEKAALTLLSGPAAGPGAGLGYVKAHDQTKCLTVDMGGTSFDAALVVDEPLMVNDGEIDRLKIALPMLGIHTIGSGGGSIGWIDAGGLLRMGPQSAGANPGPACYGKGGKRPATTDANLILGYLNPDFFAGGKMALDVEAARKAIKKEIAGPLDMSIEEAAAGMYRVACNNMAQGVREITIKRGFDPREFPMVVAGGAGPVHSCLIAQELDIPLQIVPRESSIFCAAGMLMSDLRHDFVRTFVAKLETLDWDALKTLLKDMKNEGDRLLEEENIPPQRRDYQIKFDCRYEKQYHEVSFDVPQSAIDEENVPALAEAFHDEHNRLYGYTLKDEGAPIEIINVRLQALGRVEKPEHPEEAFDGPDASVSKKGERDVYIPEDDGFAPVAVYDGHTLKYGNKIEGPAMIEQVTTAIFISRAYDCVIDKLGSFVIYPKGKEDIVQSGLEDKK